MNKTEYKYYLYGGPYHGLTLAKETDICHYIDRSRHKDNNVYGFYTIIGQYGYYGEREYTKDIDPIKMRSLAEEHKPEMFSRND